MLCIGCSKRYSPLPAFSPIPIHDSFNYSVGRFKTSYLADQIHAYYRGQTTGPLAVTTFVDLDNLYGSSTFGRVLAEQLMSELAMKGYNVIELRKSDALQVLYGEGEFALSQEIQRLKATQDLAGIIVGTYVLSPVRVYVNTRVLDPNTSLVLAAGSVEMSKTDEIDRLIRRGSWPTTLERIPVRHLGYASAPLPYYYTLPRSADTSEDIYKTDPNARPGTTDVPALPKAKQTKKAKPPEPKLEPNT